MTARTILSAFALSVLVTGGSAGWAMAQVTNPAGVAPQGGGTLSEKLERTDGVIKPRENVDPDITTPAPVPNPGTTPVIPPPGSPGGNPSVQPK
jgi:hypothetical protein